MTECLLTRFCYSEMGTFGTWEGPDSFRAFTVEDPWENNAQSKSCIPEGHYLAKRTSRPKHGNTFVLINEDLKIAEYPKPGMRDSCLIHIANTTIDVEGCIGLGERLGCLGSNWAILNSTAIVRQFMSRMDGIDEFNLTIVQSKGAR